MIKADKNMLVDAVIGKGLVGDINQRNQEADLFIRLGLGKEKFKAKIANNGDYYGDEKLGFEFNRKALNQLSMKDLMYLYTRQYKKNVALDIVTHNVKQSKRLN